MFLKRVLLNSGVRSELFRFSRSLHISYSRNKENMEELIKNPYYSKYSDKITKLQKTSPEEFLHRIEVAKRDSKESSCKGLKTVEEKGFSMPSTPKEPTSKEYSAVREKNLDSYMKLELLKDKTRDEISDIWKEYHKNKDCISAIIPADVYEEMKSRFKTFNSFLFPLPRKDGYEFVVVQFSGNEGHFTTLINFQAYKENAPECLTMVHYPELVEEKGIVLMVGEYNKDVLTSSEASCLIVQTLLYYGGNLNQEGNRKRLRHLVDFTCNTDVFNHFDLIAGLETSKNVPLSQLFQRNAIIED